MLLIFSSFQISSTVWK